jgi:anaerobic selenocysteine-containing dehydrogenase
MAASTIDILLGNVERPGSLLQRFRNSGVFDMPNYPVPIAADRLPDEQLKKRLEEMNIRDFISGMRDILPVFLMRF